MRLRLIAVFLILIAFATATFAAPNLLARSRQCLVVVAPDWNSKTGQLRAFEKVGSDWKMRGNTIPVVLGKNGLAWGLGLFDATNETGPRKVEGDNRVPAGVFRLGPAFGYAPAESARWIKLPYVPLTKETEGIDDPRSRYYNQIVERSKVAQVDWQSSEQMRRADELYKWGIFVAHNLAAKPRAGSCIFMHIWRNSSAATAGCTAMPERDLVELLRWLDPVGYPFLLQMPRSDYETIRSRYALPTIADESSR